MTDVEPEDIIITNLVDKSTTRRLIDAPSPTDAPDVPYDTLQRRLTAVDAVAVEFEITVTTLATGKATAAELFTAVETDLTNAVTSDAIDFSGSIIMASSTIAKTEYVAPTLFESEVTTVATLKPSAQPTFVPTPQPTGQPTSAPTPQPNPAPTPQPSALPTLNPTPLPTLQPTPLPTLQPTAIPTPQPTAVPTFQPSPIPTPSPTLLPTSLPGMFRYLFLTLRDKGQIGRIRSPSHHHRHHHHLYRPTLSPSILTTSVEEIAAIAASTSAAVGSTVAAAGPAGDPISLIMTVQFVAATSGLNGMPLAYKG